MGFDGVVAWLRNVMTKRHNHLIECNVSIDAILALTVAFAGSRNTPPKPINKHQIQMT
jgi:hypothetical protein